MIDLTPIEEDIAKVRAEIQPLTKRRNLLAATILSSSKIQSQLLAARSKNKNLSPYTTKPLPLSYIAHNESNIHRLAFGVTSFPFHDPSPENSDTPLLGIRFDIPSRNGRFERAPYYIFCKKTRIPRNYTADSSTSSNNSSSSTYLTVHHHTIPALIPIQSYLSKYLPKPSSSEDFSTDQMEIERDEGYYGSSSTPSINATRSSSPTTNSDHHNTSAKKPLSQNQDLHALVDAVRTDLTSWILRQEAISYLQESLGLSEDSHNIPPLLQSDQKDANQLKSLGGEKFSVRQLSAVAIDARDIRIVWRNDVLAWVRISDDGFVEKSVVYGEQNERLREVERVLAIGAKNEKCMVTDLLAQLEQVEEIVLRPSH